MVKHLAASQFQFWTEFHNFQEINSLGCYHDTVKNLSQSSIYLTFRSHHEILIRRRWYSVLSSLDATISCRIKKAVVGVTQLITALVSIHSSMTFRADMYSLMDPPGRTVLFSVDDRSLFPVDCVIGLIRMVGEFWLAIIPSDCSALTSGKSSFGLWLNFGTDSWNQS